MNPNIGDIKETIESKQLTYEQKHHALANMAERMLDPKELLGYSEEEIQAHHDKVICDLNEGIGLYRPRYILPDYQVFVEKGCAFLELEKPNTLEDLLDGLLILYHHVPSITGFPVFIGELDTLMEPFITDEATDYSRIKRFLNHVDKVISDSFCHANITSRETKAGKLILQAERELKNPTPNLSMKLNLNEYDHEFLLDALKTSLITAKPSFANDQIYGKEQENYGIASCYNALPVKGGAYTLPRLKLGTLAKRASSLDSFFNDLLPKYTKNLLSIIDKRINYLVEDSNFFETSFLAEEGFIDKERFVAMVGTIGLADGVNHLMLLQGEKGRFGSDEKANLLGHRMLKSIQTMTEEHQGVYTPVTGGKYLLHAQVGASIDETDRDNTPAHRIPVGDEPELPNHLTQAAGYHQYFPSGTGDVFSFDQTYEEHLDALADILIGSFHEGHRYLSFYGEQQDLVRVTGYLVKRSEVEKAKQEKVVRRDTTLLGQGSNEMSKVFDRKVRR